MINSAASISHRAFLVVSAFLLMSMSLVKGEQKKPNIIVVFADDISARELPLYGSDVWSDPLGKNTKDPKYRAKTPVLDRLATEGCWVTSAWAAVVCSPSRAMMMTGRYAHVHKWWTNGDQGKVQRSKKKFETWPLYESSPTQLGHVAQQAGYGTYWAGKTQMAGDLQKFGFDEGCLTPGKLEDKDNPYTDFKMYYKKVNGERALFNTDTDQQIHTYLQHGWYWMPHVRLMNAPGQKPFCWWPNTEESRKNYGLNTYGPDVEMDFIFEFMERKKKEEKPFFVYHCSHLGHDAFDWFIPDSKSRWPGTPVVKWDGKKYTRTEPNVTGDKGVYETRGTVTPPGIHHHINYLDYQMWLYVEKLKKMGIEDNTILVFCADNGTSGYGKHSPDRQKGTHVPLIIYAPGMSKKGKQDVLVNMSDFLPTVAELTGVTIPADYEINGESLVPFLFGEKKSHRDWLYAYRGPQQLIRGTKVMKDGFDKWWDVSSSPLDLISFKQIKDWDSVSEEHRAEKAKLEPLLAKYDLYEKEHDAPGTVIPERLKKKFKEARGRKKKRQAKRKKNKKQK